MATIPLRPLEVARTTTGGPAQVLSFPEAATQTFKRGAILTFDGAGRVIEASADPTQILGVAMQDGANAATAGANNIPVAIADDTTIFVGNLMKTGVVFATSLFNVGQNFGLVKVGNNWFPDADLSAHARRVLCVDMDPRDNIGDSGGRIFFMVLGFFRKLATTS